MRIKIDYNEDNLGRCVGKCTIFLNGKEYFLNELEPLDRKKAIRGLNFILKGEIQDRKLDKLGYKRKI